VVISVLSAGVATLSGLAVWYASAGHIGSPYLRGALAAGTALAPVASLESLDSAAYVPWYMLFATFWLLLWRPATMRGATLASLFILATALSTPGVWFFIPLAALRAVAVRDRRDLAIVGSFAAGAAAQIPVVALNQDQAVVDPLWTSDIWTAYLQRVLDGAAFGQRLGGLAWAHLGWPFLLLLILCAAVALAVGLKYSNRTGRYPALIAIPTSLALFVVSVYQRAVGSNVVWPPNAYHGAAGRYAIVPALLLISAALVLIANVPRREERGGSSLLSLMSAGAAILLVVAIATSFSQGDNAVRGTPRWGDALESASSACAAQGVLDVTVPTSPPGFGLQVPCDRVPSLPEVSTQR
jgi:hypothetical protein